jgi:hypothetical protein
MFPEAFGDTLPIRVGSPDMGVGLRHHTSSAALSFSRYGPVARRSKDRG